MKAKEKTLKKFKIGVFGAWRGASFIPIFNSFDELEITAICDKSKKRIEEAFGDLAYEIPCYEDFDEMLDSGIDAVKKNIFLSIHLLLPNEQCLTP